MATLEEVTKDDEMDKEIQSLSTDDIVNRTRLLENEIKADSVPCVPGLTADHEIRTPTLVARASAYDSQDQRKHRQNRE